MRNLKLLIAATNLLAYVASLSANGINPPRPTDSAIVEAKCLSKNATISLTRARLSAEAIDIKLSSTETVAVKLADVKRIKLDETAKSTGGFVSAEVELLQPKYSGAAAISIRQDGKRLTLSGFDANRKRVAFDIGKCNLLEVTVKAGASENSAIGSAEK